MRLWREAWRRAQALSPVPAERAVSAPAADRHAPTALAPGLRVFAEELASVLQSVRWEANFDALAPSLMMLAKATTIVHQPVSREAHRNGTAAPDWNTTASHVGDELSRTLAGNAFTAGTDDEGYDLVRRIGDSGQAVYQIKSHGDRPAPHPALPSTSNVPLPPVEERCMVEAWQQTRRASR